MKTILIISFALTNLFDVLSVQALPGASPQCAFSAQSRETLTARKFQRWMASVRKLAPRYGYHIAADDESWEEWFWLYYFTEGVSPQRALAATAEYDRKLRVRQKTQK